MKKIFYQSLVRGRYDCCNYEDYFCYKSHYERWWREWRNHFYRVPPLALGNFTLFGQESYENQRGGNLLSIYLSLIMGRRRP